MNSLGNIIYRVFCIISMLFFITMSVLYENLFMLIIMCTVIIVFNIYVFYSYVIERLDEIKDGINK